MIAASNPKLATNPAYAEAEVSDSVLERRDRKLFTPIAKRVYLKPDDDLRRAITMDELLKGVLEDIDEIDKMYASNEGSSKL